MAADFVVKWELGRGAFGIVYLIEKKDTKEKLALKTLDLSGHSDRDRAEREAALLRRLDNPYVVRHVTSYMRRDLLCIVTEFCEGGNLGSFLEKNSPLPEDLIVCWTAQITTALEYLHKENVLQRDLKPANVYLTGDLNICVGDLGIARVMEHRDAMATTLTGTPLHMSPEIFQRRPYSSKADIWSLGCVVFEMVAGQRAFKEHVRSGKVPSVPDSYSIPLRHLVTKMLDREPQKRPDASSLLTMSPIKDHLVSPKPPLEIMKAKRTALSDEDIKVPLDALQTRRQCTQQLGGNVTNRGGELRIVFVGKTGAGKSATCNMIAGKIKKSEHLFKTSALGRSEIKKCQMEKVERFGRLVTLVDTPGLCGIGRRSEDEEKSIGGFAVLSVPGPHAIVLVLSAAGRFTPEVVQAMKRFIDLFGKKILDYLIILITNTETWEDEEFTPVIFLRDMPSALKDVIPTVVRQHRSIAFQNTLRGAAADDQVRRLFDMIDAMVEANDESYYKDEYCKQAEELQERKEKTTEEEKLREMYQQNQELFSRVMQTSADVTNELIKLHAQKNA